MDYRRGGQWGRKCIFVTKKGPKWSKLDLKRKEMWCMHCMWRMQYEWRTRFEWRTRSEWRTRRPASSHKPTPASHPLTRGPPKGATTVPKFFVLGIFELSTVLGSTIWEKCVVDWPQTSPQPTRGNCKLKIYPTHNSLLGDNVLKC